MEFGKCSLESLVVKSEAFGGFFRGRTVLVTGHTGFKGAWLSHWLVRLGARVTGVALPPQTAPSLFASLKLEDRLDHRLLDIRDADAVMSTFHDVRPDVVFHLAAQPLVRRSYAEPLATWQTNVMGTLHVLEAIRTTSGVIACVVITSDKCYENQERETGYTEGEHLGGYDPYSSSKAAAEIAVASWRRSFIAGQGCRLATARAGNVIGGGDWNEDRIVTDFVSSIERGQPVRLRNPYAVRPWQHVLESLSGYLLLASRLGQPDGEQFAGAWNFGPAEDATATVETLARYLVEAWGSGAVEIASEQQSQPHEAGLLKLDCAKAAKLLDWHCRWGLPETARRTAHWYRDFSGGADAFSLVDADLDAYLAAMAANTSRANASDLTGM